MNLDAVLIFAGALTLGVTHAFEVDHLTAVSAFVARRPAPRQAALFGMHWALGHGATLLAFGLVLFALKMTISAEVAHNLERLVGLGLLALGVWTLMQLKASGLHHTHSHQHNHDETELIANVDNAAHQHTHADGTTHSHRHGSLRMGMLHGVAGTAAFAGEALVAVSQTYWMVIGFTLAFSFGVLVAMAAYGALLGGFLTWGERRAAAGIQAIRVFTGVWTCGIGIYWVLK